MIKKILTLVGGLLCIIIVILFYVWLAQQTIQARKRDSAIIEAAATEGCKAYIDELLPVRRIMSEGDSQGLTVYLSSSGRQSEICEAEVSIIAPDFDVKPVEALAVAVPGGRRTAQLNWILTPKKSGTFDVTAHIRSALVRSLPNPTVNSTIPVTSVHFLTSTDNILSPPVGSTTNVVGITVTNILGLNLRTASILSWVGTFLGPLLTASWWHERWKEYQQKKDAKTKLDDTELAPQNELDTSEIAQTGVRVRHIEPQIEALEQAKSEDRLAGHAFLQGVTSGVIGAFVFVVLLLLLFLLGQRKNS